MDKQQVWEIINKTIFQRIEEPSNVNGSSRWPNGIFRERLVACGNSQIPGIDFNERFAPVIYDVSFQVMLIAKLIWNLETSIVDLETAFLHGELQEENYMIIPEGMSYDSKHCLLLTKTIYGLVQSTREFYKNLMSSLNIIGFKDDKSDPCLLSKWT
jgi:hypothetical protein